MGLNVGGVTNERLQDVLQRMVQLEPMQFLCPFWGCWGVCGVEKRVKGCLFPATVIKHILYIEPP